MLPNPKLHCVPSSQIGRIIIVRNLFNNAQKFFSRLLDCLGNSLLSTRLDQPEIESNPAVSGFGGVLTLLGRVACLPPQRGLSPQ